MMWTEQAISQALGQHFWTVKYDGRIVDLCPDTAIKPAPVKRKGITRGGLWSDELESLLIKLRNDGKSWREISAVIGRCHATCRKRYYVVTARKGVQRLTRIKLMEKLPPDWRVIVKKRRDDGWAWKRCADGFDIPPETLRKMYGGYSGYEKEAA
jgi:hypothetical protein